MNIKSTLLILLFLNISSLTLAHTPWGACATIYLDLNKQGASHQVCHSGYLSSDFNDKVSSILVPDGFNMRLFKNGNYQGPFIDIQAGLWNANAEWDNQISSVNFNNWGMGCSDLYSGANKTGTKFSVCNTANLVPGYNDQVASMWVAPKHFFRIYKDYNQTGDWMDIRGSWNFSPDWVNQVKSLKLSHWNDCAWLWQGKDHGGKLFQVCDSGVLPSNWANKTNSITVPVNVTVIAYKTNNYQGESVTFTEGFNNFPDGWGNAIQSVRLKIVGAMTTQIGSM